jgi:hypothetical protein
LRAGSNLRIAIDFSADVTGDSARATIAELRQVLQELGVADTVRIEEV